MGKFQKRTNMKKSIIALFAAATMVAGVNAQDESGGTGLGVTTGGLVGTGIIGAAIVGGIASNNSATTPDDDDDVVDPVLSCEGDDEIVDGVCLGTTNTLTSTVTVSGTQTVTKTITVPVTFTYAPTIQ